MNLETKSFDLKGALDIIKKFCLSKEIKLAVAESVSSGHLQSLFSQESEAGLFYEGGITTYSCTQKKLQLLINPELCNPCNGVSKDISQTMAKNIAKLFDVDLSLSLTGYASPLPEQNIFDLYAYGSICLHQEIIYCEKIRSERSQPEEIREDYAAILIRNCSALLASRLQGR
ncbi:CinA family protein [Negadavirga shengliensis]|uniref:CinA family protein n=1 Tax=Negadavirga shengliensis TaxID=1389218 RepID=A0ABV9SW90_9BACT